MRPMPIATLGRTLAIAASLVVAGCTAGAGSAAPTTTAGSTAVPSTAPPSSIPVAATPAAATPAAATATVPVASPTVPAPTATTRPATPAPSPTERSYPSPRPTSLKRGDVVETLVADVRVRSKPRVADSARYEPLLPAGTKLYVLDGPVRGSGYNWFWVAQLSPTELPSGWVAAAGRDGEAWLGPSDYDCPPVPDDVRSLATLPRGAGVACFAQVPITFRARLFQPNGDADPGDDWIEPTWLWTAGFNLIFGPSSVRPEGPSLPLLPDPAGHYPGKLEGACLPAELPVGKYVEGDRWTIPHVVKITGMFDHPAARTCTWVSYGEPDAMELPFDPAVAQCRLEFAVTRIVVP